LGDDAYFMGRQGILRVAFENDISFTQFTFPVLGRMLRQNTPRSRLKYFLKFSQGAFYEE